VLVVHLIKAMYGLKEAYASWYDTLSNHLKDLGFNPSKHDASFFIKDKYTFILVHVDDLLIITEKGYQDEAIKHIDEKEVEFNFVDNLSPLQINPRNVEGYMYIVLPVRA
ncbi:MAG: reverse transcriptase domain-containing protein, partial [Fervidobacterium pennivorans]